MIFSYNSALQRMLDFFTFQVDDNDCTCELSEDKSSNFPPTLPLQTHASTFGLAVITPMWDLNLGCISLNFMLSYILQPVVVC